MLSTLHGKTCTLILFEQPGGVIRSLFTMEGVLDVSGEAVSLLSQGGGATDIPPHLVGDIEPVTDEHRECIEIATEYCLRAFYDGRVKANRRAADIDAALARSSGPPAAG